MEAAASERVSGSRHGLQKQLPPNYPSIRPLAGSWVNQRPKTSDLFSWLHERIWKWRKFLNWKVGYSPTLNEWKSVCLVKNQFPTDFFLTEKPVRFGIYIWSARHYNFQIIWIMCVHVKVPFLSRMVGLVDSQLGAKKVSVTRPFLPSTGKHTIFIRSCIFVLYIF